MEHSATAVHGPGCSPECSSQTARLFRAGGSWADDCRSSNGLSPAEDPPKSAELAFLRLVHRKDTLRGCFRLDWCARAPRPVRVHRTSRYVDAADEYPREALRDRSPAAGSAKNPRS